MRRFIAYISMALAMLLCVGVAVTPVFSKMKPGREFTSGHEIVYRLKDKEAPEAGVPSLDGNDEAAAEVADEIKSRLDKMYVEDYSVKVQGNDTISVNFATNDETQLNYIAKYLGFNGGDFSLSGKNEETRITKDKIFDNVEARIYKENDIVPYVVIPLSDPEPVKTLIETLNKEDEGDSSSKSIIKRADDHDHEGGESEGEGEKNEPDIFLWANWVEGDSYEKAESDAAITGQKIIASFNSSNIWFQHSGKDKEETEIAYLCGFGDSEGNYDTKKLEQANQMANYICNMFNASSYKYEVEYLYSTQSASGVVYNSIITKAAGENLLIFGSDVNVAVSYTLISIIVAFAVCSLLLVMFYRLSAIGVIANTSLSVFLTYLLFFAMGATFNIGAIIGGVLLSLSSAFTAIAYLTKFKEEVYKGRPIRKANTEASKRMNLLTIDVGVVTAFMGLMLYVLGGVALKPLGIILFFGGFISLVLNLSVFKILMYLLTNTTAFQTKYKLFNIDEKVVPNIMEEEKPTYVAPYEKVNFEKAKKPFGILALVLAVASAAVITVFGVLDKSPLNVKQATQNTTVVYSSIRADKLTLESEDAFRNYVLKNITVDGDELDLDQNNDVMMSTREEYDYETSYTTKYTIFVTNFASEIKEGADIKYTISGTEYSAATIDEAINEMIESVEGEDSSGYIEVSAKLSSQKVNVPNQGMVALAAGLGIVGAALYCAFRYRPSRGLALLLTSGTATAFAYGFFVMIRVGTSAITAIAMPVVALVSILATLYLLNKEKDLVKEEKGQISVERRAEINKRALGLAAAPIIYFLLIAVYVAINFFGFLQITAFTEIFASMLVGVITAAVLVLTVQVPLSNRFDGWFSKIKLPQFKRKSTAEKIKLQPKKNSSEPEERIFIGIND